MIRYLLRAGLAGAYPKRNSLDATGMPVIIGRAFFGSATAEFPSQGLPKSISAVCSYSTKYGCCLGISTCIHQARSMDIQGISVSRPNHSSWTSKNLELSHTQSTTSLEIPASLHTYLSSIVGDCTAIIVSLTMEEQGTRHLGDFAKAPPPRNPPADLGASLCALSLPRLLAQPRPIWSKEPTDSLRQSNPLPRGRASSLQLPHPYSGTVVLL